MGVVEAARVDEVARVKKRRIMSPKVLPSSLGPYSKRSVMSISSNVFEKN